MSTKEMERVYDMCAHGKIIVRFQGRHFTKHKSPIEMGQTATSHEQ